MDPFALELDHANEILSASIGVDAHVDTLQRLLIEGADFGLALPNGHIDYPRLLKGKVALIVCALWTPTYYPRRAALERTFDLLAATRKFCSQSNRFRIADSMTAALEIIRHGSIAISLSLEGCDALGGDLSLLKEFREAGISSIGLTHVSANDLADASTALPVHGGLSTLGRRAVMEMNRLGVLIDVSHCSDEAVRQVLDISVQPVIASHSCCRALCRTPRNLPDELIRAIAEGGGVVCIACHAGFLHPGDVTEISRPIVPAPRQLLAREALDNRLAAEHQASLQLQLLPHAELGHLADHVEHALRLAGPNGVAIGSDFDGGITPPRGYEDVSRRPYLAAELVRRGCSDAHIIRIFGRNLIGVFSRVQMPPN